MMSLDTVSANLLPVFQAIDDAIGQRRSLPALILIYATIDIAASLQREQDEGVRKPFERWVDRYMLPHTGLACSSTDLYAARCGILHTLTAEADLIAAGTAKRLIYAWGTGEPEKLQAVSDRLGHTQHAVHIATLRDAVAKGVNTLLDSAEADPVLLARVNAASQHWFTFIDKSVVDAFLARRPEAPPAT